MIRKLFGNDPDAGKDWRQEEKGTTEVEMVGWHHWLSGHEFEQAPGVGDGQGSLGCCSPWGCKESDITEQLNWTGLNWDRMKFLLKKIYVWLSWFAIFNSIVEREKARSFLGSVNSLKHDNFKGQRDSQTKWNNTVPPWEKSVKGDGLFSVSLS